jgi:hypothetical protein
MTIYGQGKLPVEAKRSEAITPKQQLCFINQKHGQLDLFMATGL